MGGIGNLRAFPQAKRDPKKLVAAAVKAADEGGEPPPDLRIMWWCEQFPGALPEAGGLYQQDHAIIRRMTTLNNIYNAVTRLRSMKGAQIHQLSAGERRLIRALRDEGML